MFTVFSIEVLSSKNSICGRILVMDDSLRVKGLSYTAANGVRIESHTNPEITESTLWIRGSDRDSDDSYFVGSPFSTDTPTMLLRIIFAVQEFLRAYYGDHLVYRIMPTNGGYVYQYDIMDEIPSQFFSKE